MSRWFPIPSGWRSLKPVAGRQPASLRQPQSSFTRNNKKLLPAPFEPWVIEAAAVAFIVCACLTLASIGSASVRASRRPAAKLRRLWTIRTAKHQIAKGIPNMTPKEKDIIGYLLAMNERMFTYTPDGGHANTLISRGIIQCALLPGQAYTNYGVPFKVADYAWDVFMKHKAAFPYTPSKPGENKPYPWAVHWMAR